MQLLLDHGSDVLAKTKQGNSAEDIANGESHHELAATLKAAAKQRIMRRVSLATGQQERLGSGSSGQQLDVKGWVQPRPVSCDG